MGATSPFTMSLMKLGSPPFYRPALLRNRRLAKDFENLTASFARLRRPPADKCDSAPPSASAMGITVSPGAANHAFRRRATNFWVALLIGPEPHPYSSRISALPDVRR
jgi:hypothetical protein